MPFFDLPLDQLRTYLPPRQEAEDFDTFWQTTILEADQYPLNAQFQLVDYGLMAQEVFDVTYAGYGGQPIRTWLILPRQRSNPIPCVIEYIGYTEGRGFPIDWLVWSSAGYANLIMGNRGQGSGSVMQGATPDEGGGGRPSVPGFMTQGILDPRRYYYRRIYTDAVRAVEAARSHNS